MKGEEFLHVNSPAARGFAGAWLRTVRAALLSVGFAAGCRICEPLLTEATRIPICRNCLDSFAPMTETVCDKCGRPVESDWTSDDEVFVCPACKNEAWGGYAFDGVRSWTVYEGALVRAILFLKFENIERLGKLFSRWLAEIVKRGGPTFEADVVVPLPLHRQRGGGRGYN
jgi:predicted amidophosphoribosyltransferase